MEEIVKSKSRAPIWQLKLCAIFLLITVIGLIPWEHFFKIEINNEIIKTITDSAVGFIGLSALLITVTIIVTRYDKWFSFFAIITLAVAVVFALISTGLSLVMPAFRWKDDVIYRNGSDYLVLQHFEGFVTTSDMNRLLRTENAYGPIRFLEENRDLSLTDNRFGGKIVIYENKIWVKQEAKAQ